MEQVWESVEGGGTIMYFQEYHKNGITYSFSSKKKAREFIISEAKLLLLTDNMKNLMVFKMKRVI